MYAGRRGAKWAALLGLVCGVLYSVGGFFYDLFTVGLNGGTALAFLALAGMPALFGVVGLIVGFLVAGAANGLAGVAGWFRPRA
jgi:hypothetical protein